MRVILQADPEMVKRAQLVEVSWTVPPEEAEVLFYMAEQELKKKTALGNWIATLYTKTVGNA